MLRRQRIDCEHAVGDDRRIDRGAAVEADEQVGGESLTLQTAVAVKPARPAGPSVVTILTAAPSRDIVCRKSSLVTEVVEFGKSVRSRVIPSSLQSQTILQAFC